jgi:hypothetical protein
MVSVLNQNCKNSILTVYKDEHPIPPVMSSTMQVFKRHKKEKEEFQSEKTLKAFW